MGNLVLNSLKVENFRIFKNLRIERLGRVNLITGKNNVGKTALLEALWLYMRNAAPFQLLESLLLRDEWLERTRNLPTSLPPRERGEQLSNIRHLFYCRKKIAAIDHPIWIEPLFGHENVALSIAINWFKQEDTERINSLPLTVEAMAQEPEGIESRVPYVVVRNSNQILYRYSLERLFDGTLGYVPERKIIPGSFIRLQGLSAYEKSRLWDKIALTPQEDAVYSALRIISPDVERVSFIGEEDQVVGRVPIIKIKGFEEPVTLRSLGEGMNRLFGIALAIANAKDGMLLIDEVESGLHYSVLPEAWKFIFQTAARLNVQVFATTHSWDCIEAFQEIANADVKEEGVLIRLDNKKAGVSATLFDEEELSIAAQEHIEVR